MRTRPRHRISRKKAVTFFSISLAVLTYAIHDEIRDELKDAQETLSSAVDENRAFEYKQDLQLEIADLRAVLMSRLSNLDKEPATRSAPELSAIRLNQDRDDFQQFRNAVEQSRDKLFELLAVLNKLPEKVRAQPATDEVNATEESFGKLLHDCELEQRFWATLLLTADDDANHDNDGILSEDISRLGGSNWELNSVPIFPRIRPDAFLHWSTNASALGEVEAAVAKLVAHHHLLTKDINSFAFAIDIAAEDRLSLLHIFYLLATITSYLLYIFVFVFNLWVLFFSKVEPEAPG